MNQIRTFTLTELSSLSRSILWSTASNTALRSNQGRVFLNLHIHRDVHLNLYNLKKSFSIIFPIKGRLKNTWKKVHLWILRTAGSKSLFFSWSFIMVIFRSLRKTPAFSDLFNIRGNLELSYYRRLSTMSVEEVEVFTHCTISFKVNKLIQLNSDINGESVLSFTKFYYILIENWYLIWSSEWRLCLTIWLPSFDRKKKEIHYILGLLQNQGIALTGA